MIYRYTVMRDCWQFQPERRPTFASLGDQLGTMLEESVRQVSSYLYMYYVWNVLTTVSIIYVFIVIIALHGP